MSSSVCKAVFLLAFFLFHEYLNEPRIGGDRQGFFSTKKKITPKTNTKFWRVLSENFCLCAESCLSQFLAVKSTLSFFGSFQPQIYDKKIVSYSKDIESSIIKNKDLSPNLKQIVFWKDISLKTAPTAAAIWSQLSLKRANWTLCDKREGATESNNVIMSQCFDGFSKPSHCEGCPLGSYN